eukprot:1251278-Amphidinium_carterae.1
MKHSDPCGKLSQVAALLRKMITLPPVRIGLAVQTSKILFVAANYVDILAFMPVVWRLYQVRHLKAPLIGFPLV